MRNHRPLAGITLVELMVVLVIVGILGTLAVSNYQSAQDTVFDREAQGYLHLLRHAARAYRGEWNVYPDALADIPQAMVPAPGDASSHWVYSLTGGGAAWSLPRATRKVGGRQIQIRLDGEFE